MIRYRIYTEDKGIAACDEVASLVSKSFDGFTAYRGTGFWRGVSEHNLTIEILVDEETPGTVETLAGKIRTLLKQEAVLVTRERVGGTLIDS